MILAYLAAAWTYLTAFNKMYLTFEWRLCLNLVPQLEKMQKEAQLLKELEGLELGL